MSTEKCYYVYIMSSRSRNLYTGMTNELERRVYEHKRGLSPGFTKKYHIGRLVYFEAFRDVWAGIARKKQVKAWTIAKRIALIESQSATWSDLAEAWEKRWARVERSVKKAQGESKVQIPRSARDDKRGVEKQGGVQTPRPPQRTRDDRRRRPGAKGKQED